MTKVINFLHKYGYVAAEELIFRVLALAVWGNWYGVIFVSGIAFGLCHYWLGWWQAFAAIGVGILFGWAYVFVIPFPLNIIAVVGAHLAWALGYNKWKKGRLNEILG